MEKKKAVLERAWLSFFFESKVLAEYFFYTKDMV